jgi:hypothetical protein
MTIKDILLSVHQRMGDKSIESLNLFFNGKEKGVDWGVVDVLRGPMFYSLM